MTADTFCKYSTSSNAQMTAKLAFLSIPGVLPGHNELFYLQNGYKVARKQIATRQTANLLYR